MTHLSAPSLLPLSVLYYSVSVCLGDITQKGYEKKRSKLLAPYLPQIEGKTHVPAGDLFSRAYFIFAPVALELALH